MPPIHFGLGGVLLRGGSIFLLRSLVINHYLRGLFGLNITRLSNNFYTQIDKLEFPKFIDMISFDSYLAFGSFYFENFRLR